MNSRMKTASHLLPCDDWGLLCSQDQFQAKEGPASEKMPAELHRSATLLEHSMADRG